MFRFLWAGLLFLSTQASAQQFICDFDSWRGASDDIGASWTGEKVFIDTAQNLIQRGFSDGWYEPQGISAISRTADFTTYTTRSRERDTTGSTFEITMSFRVYSQGKGTARIDAGARMQDITATGTCSSG